MKMSSTLTHHPRLITATIFGALALSFGVASTAADHSDVHQTVVKFSDLDVSKPLDDTTLYSRIETAADEVCDSYATDDDELDGLSETQRDICVHEAIANAVNQIDLPQLFAIYEAKNQRLR